MTADNRSIETRLKVAVVGLHQLPLLVGQKLLPLLHGRQVFVQRDQPDFR